MCTLTYWKNRDTIVITSNRDEHHARAAALPPAELLLNGRKIYAPVDQASGGSWLVVRDDGLVSVVLNGAEFAHAKAPSYRKSRGLVLLELLAFEDVEEGWNKINLDAIEPFTLVHLGKNQLIRQRWNGTTKETLHHDVEQPHLWCSATLFSPEQAQNRLASFQKSIEVTAVESLAESLLRLHQRADEASDPGFLMNRSQQMLTKNIIQVRIRQQEFSLSYLDVGSGETTGINGTFA